MIYSVAKILLKLVLNTNHINTVRIRNIIICVTMVIEEMLLSFIGMRIMKSHYLIYMLHIILCQSIVMRSLVLSSQSDILKQKGDCLIF
jgi:hypothetical protein